MALEPPGTILIVSGEILRYADCVIDIMQLERPAGTAFTWQRSCSVVDNLNMGIRKMRGEWLFLMGDDHRFAPDLLMRLLKHEVDFVAPFVLKRSHPFQPCVYDEEVAPGKWSPAFRADLPPTGLYEAKAGTTAGLLVRKRVLDAIGDPWFKHSGPVAGMIAEDVTFWKEARSLGFKGYIDMDAKLGHVTPMTIWPIDGGKMGADLEISPGVHTTIMYAKEQQVDDRGNVVRERG